MNHADRLRLVDADFAPVSDQRRADRRDSDRRVARFRLDPKFAATLINHIAPAEREPAMKYECQMPPVRTGAAFDIKA